MKSGIVKTNEHDEGVLHSSGIDIIADRRLRSCDVVFYQESNS